MTQLQFFKSKMRKEKLPTVTAFSSRDSLSKLGSPLGLSKEFFLLLQQYEEEMLDAFLQDDDYFPPVPISPNYKKSEICLNETEAVSQ